MSTRLKAVVGIIAVAIAIALTAILATDNGVSPMFEGKKGVLEKNETIGVSAPDGERIAATFKKPSGKLEKSPLQNLFDVIGQPVDITPEHQTAGTSVSFRVPKHVPLDAKGKDGRLQRSIYNAAIQVYEPAIGGWATLDTRVEGDVLTATAPHFSVYQAVWLKMGEQKVGEIKVTTTPKMSPGEMLWRTGYEYLKQFAFNAIGKFDESKFDCKNVNEDYEVTLEKPNKKDEFDVCVTKKDEGHSTILIKNGWAVPLRVTTSVGGVTPETRPGDIDLVTMVRNHMGKAFTGGAYASGLDVGSFTLDHEVAPEKFTVKAEYSWLSTALDVTLAMLTAFFPASRMVEQAGPLIDMGNCLAVAAQKNLMGTPGTDVPAKLMETAKSCMAPFLIDRLGLKGTLGSFASAFAKEAKILPELAQMGKIAAMKQLTGEDPTATSATIEEAAEFEELQGLWTYECGGSYDLFGVNGRDVSWTITSYTGDSGSVETKTYAKGVLSAQGNKTLMTVEETNITGLKAGMVADVAVLQGPGAPSVDIKFSQSNRFGYTRRGGPSYC